MFEFILTSSVLILVITALRAVLKGRIGLRLQYALWLVVLVRLLLPAPLFESRLSVMNALEHRESQTLTVDNRAGGNVSIPVVPEQSDSPVTAPAVGGMGGTRPQITLPQTGSAAAVSSTEPAAQPQLQADLSWTQVLHVVWYCGIGVVGLFLLLSNLCFWLRLRRARRPVKLDCGHPVYLVKRLASPCIFVPPGDLSDSGRIGGPGATDSCTGT